MDSQTKVARKEVGEKCEAKIDTRNRITPLFVLMCACTVSPWMAPAQQTSVGAQFADAARLVVMIEASLDGVPSQGAGIIFAVKDNKAFVLTANHVVRSNAVATRIHVYFSASPDDAVDATILPQYSPELDLAVLQADVSMVDLQAERLLPFELLAGSSFKLQRGDPVYPIGYPAGFKWASPLLAPDRFDRRDKDHFYFQSHSVKVGYSGGAIFSADWQIMGIVLAVAEAPMVMALPIETALKQIKEWGFVVGSATSGGAETGVSAPSTASVEKTAATSNQAEGGLKEAVTTSGAVYRAFSPWGGFSDTVAAWVQLVAQRIEDIPPLKTFLGNTPDFHLVLSGSSGTVSDVSLQGGNRCTFPPMAETEADGGLVRMTRARGLLGESDVTIPAAITFPKLMQGEFLRLRYVDSVMQEIRDHADSTEVTMFIQAQQFLPDGKSGEDRDPATAPLLTPGTVKEDAVSFNDGIATHHIVMNQTGGSCKGLLWIEASGSVGLTSTARKVKESSVSLLIEGPAEPRVKLYEIRCEGQQTIIRIQAETPGSRANYDVFVRSDSNEGLQRLAGPLMGSWIGSWVRSQKDTFEFRQVTDSEWNTIDRGIGIIRSYTSGTTEDFINALNEALDKGTEDMFDGIKSGYWKFLESLVSRHRDEISASLVNCCQKSTKVRFMTNLLRAEARLPYDGSALNWAKSQNNLPEDLLRRASAATSSSAPK